MTFPPIVIPLVRGMRSSYIIALHKPLVVDLDGICNLVSEGGAFVCCMVEIAVVFAMFLRVGIFL